VDTQTKKYMPNKVRRRKVRDARLEARKTSGEAMAKAKFVKVAPRKARLVADVIRGKKVNEAVNILTFIPKKAARVLLKVVNSAIANAENNHDLDVENLYIHRAFVDGGPMLKRFTAKAMGRATPIRRRTSHITIVVKERGDVK
jgi:large subunit ribosomal protein L22